MARRVKWKDERGDACGEAALSPRSLRPVAWPLTLFDMEAQSRRRTETETQRGRHRSSMCLQGPCEWESCHDGATSAGEHHPHDFHFDR